MTESVGIVLVSHSAELANALRELLLQVAGDGPVMAAGGTEDGRLGTSDERVRAAIDQADRGGGVLVFADLGSAVLTTRAVLDDDPHEQVVLVDAPFVEGAVAAAVLAGSGAGFDAVLAVAREARNVPKF